MPTQIEQIADGGMRGDESLCLLHRFESPHPVLPVNSDYLIFLAFFRCDVNLIGSITIAAGVDPENHEADYLRAVTIR